MKVIKHGKCYVENKTVKCSECGCEFEVENKDVVKRKINEHIVAYTYCPECECKQYVELPGDDDK